MSTKKTTPQRRTLPALAGADQQEHRDILAQLEDFRAIQQQYAAPIIAAGVFNNSGDGWTGALSSLAERDALASYRALNGLFDRLETASPHSTRIVFPLGDDPNNEDFASDVLTAHAVSWGDAGFLLGLAVGMQLGPHAFDISKAGVR